MNQRITAEMTANVWKVLVSVGDAVADGDEIAILESMKMEIPVLSEIDGVISELLVKENEQISEGSLIAVVSAED